MSLEEIIPFFSGKGKILLLIFFCIPFGQIFGLAIPAGLLIGYLGFRYAFTKKIRMPHFLLKKKMGPRVLQFVVKQLLFFVRFIAKLSHPRRSWVCTDPTMRKINGCLIGLLGISLAISLPIPLSSYIASVALLFLGVGILNDDGIWVYIAYPLSIFYIAFVVLTLNYISIIDLIHRYII